MQVIFEVSNAPKTTNGDYLRVQAVRCIRTTLRSMGWLVLRAKVKLSGGDEPHGGLDKRCEVELTTDGGEPVVITSLARDWQSALHSALARASKSLLYRWQHEHGARPLVRARGRRLVGMAV